MKPMTPAARAALILVVSTLALPLSAAAQNIAIVNGKAVPKARVDVLLQEAARAGQQIAPEMQAQASGTEYRARHILVESEEEAKKLTAQIKGGPSLEELAKTHSKDAGSGQNGGDLDFAKAESYVPEFGGALTKLQKGQMTEVPVKSQFGWHIIRLEETRDAPFPAFEEVKPQLKQRMEQAKMQQFQDALRDKAKTDYKFSQP